MKQTGTILSVVPIVSEYEFMSDSGLLCRGLISCDVNDVKQFINKKCDVNIVSQYGRLISIDTPASTADEKPSKTIAEEEFQPTWETK